MPRRRVGRCLHLLLLCGRVGQALGLRRPLRPPEVPHSPSTLAAAHHARFPHSPPRRVAVSPRRRVALLLALALACAAVLAANDFADVDRIAGELGGISGFRLERRIDCGVITRDELNKFLNERVKEVATPEEIRAEELTLKKFGLVPQEFDLARTTVDLLTEQAIAFYDYRKHKLFVTEAAPSATREAALVHELAHALADQRFNLERYIKQAHKSDDGALARMAVMEGQATWLMSEYLARRMGQSLATSPRTHGR